MSFDINKIRNQLRSKLSSRPQDPNEFRPPKGKKDETIKVRFYVLPPLVKGDKCSGGVASRSMDDLFCIKHGNHWVNNRPHPCPRTNNDEPCEMCDAGFEMLHEVEDKDKRAAIIRNWLSQQVFLVNVYFPNIASNPEALRGKVMFFNAPKTCFDQWFKAVNRDSGGDAADPEAFGVFYDPEAAYLYQLEVALNGNNNSYKTSKFLAQMGAHPIARLKDGNPDTKRIQAIMEQRHDLWTKIEPTNPAKIRQMTNQMLNGEDSEDDVAGPGAAAANAAKAKVNGAAPKVTTQATTQATTQVAAPKTNNVAKVKSAATTPKKPVLEDELPAEGDEGTLETELPAEGAEETVEGDDGEGLAAETAEDLAAEEAAEAPPPKPGKKPAPVTKAAPQKPTAAKPAVTTKPVPASAKKPAPKPAPQADEADDSEIDRLLGELTPTES